VRNVQSFKFEGLRDMLNLVMSVGESEQSRSLLTFEGEFATEGEFAIALEARTKAKPIPNLNPKKPFFHIQN
jgi:hypothetical protein